jgi:hypothetical protein
MRARTKHISILRLSSAAHGRAEGFEPDRAAQPCAKKGRGIDIFIKATAAQKLKSTLQNIRAWT